MSIKKTCIIQVFKNKRARDGDRSRWGFTNPVKSSILEKGKHVVPKVAPKLKIKSTIFIMNYSRNSIWTDNCAMNLKIDPCSHNITQLTRQKGIKFLWKISEHLLSCQGSLIVAIPAAHSAYRYLKVSHRIHSYKGSCYTTWMWYILLNGLLLQQSSAVLNGRYQCAYFAYFLITPIV